MKRNYTKRQPKIWTSEKVQFLHENYPNFGSKYCGEKLGLTPQQAFGKAKLEGLCITKELKTKYSIQNGKNRKSFSGINADFFTTPQTKEACYILGFLWADGYLVNTEKSIKTSHRTIGLEILESDWLNIQQVFSKAGKWVISRITKSYHDNIKELRKNVGVRIQTCNKPLFNFLLEKDYAIKSLCAPTKILQIIPEHLKKYWWRGYFDGDGCFYVNKKRSLYQVTFAGSFEQDWGEVINLLNSLQIKWKEVKFEKSYGKGSCITTFSKDRMQKFGQFLYKEYDELGLKRKYEKFMLSNS